MKFFKSSFKALKSVLKSICNFLKFTLSHVFSRRMGRRSTALILTAAIGLSMFTMLFDLVSTEAQAKTIESQTEYATVSDKQRGLFKEIQQDIFGEGVYDTALDTSTVFAPSVAADTTYTTNLVKNNGYFNWTDTSQISAVLPSDKTDYVGTGEETNVRAITENYKNTYSATSWDNYSEAVEGKDYTTQTLTNISFYDDNGTKGTITYTMVVYYVYTSLGFVYALNNKNKKIIEANTCTTWC